MAFDPISLFVITKYRSKYIVMRHESRGRRFVWTTGRLFSSLDRNDYSRLRDAREGTGSVIIVIGIGIGINNNAEKDVGYSCDNGNEDDDDASERKGLFWGQGGVVIFFFDIVPATAASSGVQRCPAYRELGTSFGKLPRCDKALDSAD